MPTEEQETPQTPLRRRRRRIPGYVQILLFLAIMAIVAAWPVYLWVNWMRKSDEMFAIRPIETSIAERNHFWGLGLGNSARLVSAYEEPCFRDAYYWLQIEMSPVDAGAFVKQKQFKGGWKPGKIITQEELRPLVQSHWKGYSTATNCRSWKGRLGEYEPEIWAVVCLDDPTRVVLYLYVNSD